ncbi:glycoside hydrolase family 104 protein [Burkholderia sp. Ac-20344]|uniref:glycoside hydrolase family 24 protein n=1 Tax=Burkholderia sp. Ac-20344 TaxID=2703890 RepID=UPI001F121C40|nr:glycoside hydrolase family 104 protein [Burkholderia sp. Ac-20344]
MSDNAGLAVLVLAAGAAAMLTMSGSASAIGLAPDNGSADGSVDWTGSLDNVGADLMNNLGLNNTTQAGDPGTNLRAFLDMIAMSEIGPSLLANSDNGYNVVVGGSLFDNGYADHPRIVVRTRYGLSDAAGRYQAMAAVPGQIKTNTWDWISARLGLTDFSPASQDAMATYILQWKGAYNDVLAGNIQSAISKVAGQWASLPGSPYGQSPHDMGTVLSWYQSAGGAVA